KIENPERKEQMVVSIANFMKMAYVTWNKDAVTDDTILNDLKELANGELTIPDNLTLTKVEFKSPPPGNRSRPSVQSSKTRSNSNSGGRNQGGSGSSNSYK